MQTSFDANLVRAECSAVGVARALPLTDRDNFLCLFFNVFEIFAYVESGCLCASNDISNLRIVFSQNIISRYCSEVQFCFSVANILRKNPHRVCLHIDKTILSTL